MKYGYARLRVLLTYAHIRRKIHPLMKIVSECYVPRGAARRAHPCTRTKSPFHQP
ncbi:hypothetical protein HMPREF9248_1152 [Fannyhessea vaginae PB189-T1-4]|uniref:Uncharacterized protein n=1 Tax=Fannyhessea vaginae PB189-T1-4 TaxID=866774 RepID=A0ABN0B1P5_9ACTN|nr:hypothetical protein HMPREF9248_1152 [Fannyhessea vaginae PB189-T1-4]